MIQKSLDNLSHKNSPLHGFGEQDTTSLELYCTDGEINSILASPRAYLITLSALANTFGGIVRPICLAAFRLMINSNFVGCSTARSAGLAPFRIFLPYVCARREKSVMLGPEVMSPPTCTNSRTLRIARSRVF